ncbi:E3 ubiquitin-protein ligase ZNRF1 isoform X2 [Tursiops truncatus]|uniref:RING-type E3 ubiquitin transferase n=1 Tax=Tursiops truncatus TaxID=9739 RepID=A0A6J3QBM1_TURTR|nr:E3 ubiquitin-protein ligase ZNRF1 isoform X2 [Tursiops truncatus]
MGGKQSTAARSRGPFPGVSTDDSAVPPPGGAPHFGHYRAGGGAMGLRSRSVSSVAGMGMDPSTAGGVPFGLYTPASRGTGDSERAPGGGGSASDSTYAHGNGYQETGGGHHRDGMLYLGSRASLADALPLHIAPRWFSSHSGFKCPICSKSVASDEMEMHFIMCLSKPRLSYNVIPSEKRGESSPVPLKKQAPGLIPLPGSRPLSQPGPDRTDRAQLMQKTVWD